MEKDLNNEPMAVKESQMSLFFDAIRANMRVNVIFGDVDSAGVSANIALFSFLSYRK